MASLNGKIFADEKSKLAYATKLLEGTLGLMRLPSISGLEELSGISQIIFRIHENFKYNILVLSDVFQRQYLPELTEFVNNCLKLLQNCTESDLKAEIEECFNSLLDAWVLLLGEQEASRSNPLMKACTARIFQLYTTTRLAIARMELQQEDEEEEDEIMYEEQLNAIAFLAR